MNIRLLPPPNGGNTTVNGRTYVAAAGATLDVPDFDAQVLSANGWTKVAAQVGATATRPALPFQGQTFHDTTLGYVVVFEGKAWRNPSTGAAV